MNGMLEKGKKEKHAEQVQFAAYKQFCDDTTVEKSRAIKEAAEEIEVLKAGGRTPLRNFIKQSSQLCCEEKRGANRFGN